MTQRFVYIPSVSDNYLVDKKSIEFQWHPGFSKSQKQKCIQSLHQAYFDETGNKNILEISSSSKKELGVKASAFNLQVSFGQEKSSVECFYQASKVFELGGPYLDIKQKSSYEAKKDIRIKNSGRLKYFLFEDVKWELNDGFYDWLYLNALLENEMLSAALLKYEAFTDIAFNPKKSFNCQAYSAAMFVSLTRKKINWKIFDLKRVSLYKDMVIKTVKPKESLF